MDIRRAQPGDYDEALRLVKQVHYMHYEHLSYLYNDIEPLPRDRFYAETAEKACSAGHFLTGKRPKRPTVIVVDGSRNVNE